MRGAGYVPVASDKNSTQKPKRSWTKPLIFLFVAWAVTMTIIVATHSSSTKSKPLDLSIIDTYARLNVKSAPGCLAITSADQLTSAQCIAKLNIIGVDGTDWTCFSTTQTYDVCQFANNPMLKEGTGLLGQVASVWDGSACTVAFISWQVPSCAINSPDKVIHTPTGICDLPRLTSEKCTKRIKDVSGVDDPSDWLCYDTAQTETQCDFSNNVYTTTWEGESASVWSGGYCTIAFKNNGALNGCDNAAPTPTCMDVPVHGTKCGVTYQCQKNTDGWYVPGMNDCVPKTCQEYYYLDNHACVACTLKNSANNPDCYDYIKHTLNHIMDEGMKLKGVPKGVDLDPPIVTNIDITGKALPAVDAACTADIFIQFIVAKIAPGEQSDWADLCNPHNAKTVGWFPTINSLTFDAATMSAEIKLTAQFSILGLISLWPKFCVQKPGCEENPSGDQSSGWFGCNLIYSDLASNPTISEAMQLFAGTTLNQWAIQGGYLTQLYFSITAPISIKIAATFAGININAVVSDDLSIGLPWTSVYGDSGSDYFSDATSGDYKVPKPSAVTNLITSILTTQTYLNTYSQPCIGNTVTGGYADQHALQTQMSDYKGTFKTAIENWLNEKLKSFTSLIASLL